MSQQQCKKEAGEQRSCSDDCIRSIQTGASRFAPGQPPAVTSAVLPLSPPALARSVAGIHFTRRSDRSAAANADCCLTSRIASLCLQRIVPCERTSGRSDRTTKGGAASRAEDAGRSCQQRQEGIVSCRCAGQRNPGKAPVRSRFPRNGCGPHRIPGKRPSVAVFPTGCRPSVCWRDSWSDC